MYMEKLGTVAAQPLHEDAVTQSGPMLTELQKAHSVLLQAIDAMEVTCGAPPSRESIIASRWSISRASLARRMLWSKIHVNLLSGASKEEADDLRRLAQSDRELLRCSSQHVGRWRIEEVLANWTTYCDESRTMRWKMKAAIGAEKRVLYPMLATRRA